MCLAGLYVLSICRLVYYVKVGKRRTHAQQM